MEAVSRGYKVIFITGTSGARPEGADVVETESAADMFAAVMENYKKADIIIGAAAVGDFTADRAAGKIKRKGAMTLELKPTKDIMAAVGKKKGRRVLVGFSAEAGHMRGEAIRKISAKNLDMAVFNDITKKGAGFGSDNNEIEIIGRDGKKLYKGAGPKSKLAGIILDFAGKAGLK